MGNNTGKVKDYYRTPKGSGKGITTAVQPIRQIKDIKAIQKIISDSPRDALLFTMGINTGLRLVDLLRLKVSQVIELKAGDHINIKEGKTNKQNTLNVNEPIYKALQHYLNEANPKAGDYLFRSRKGNKALGSASAGQMIKGWCKEINLQGQYGTHTLRKTWGYHQRVTYGVGFALICERYKHSNPAVTMRYLGIENKEIYDILMNGIGA